jgi:hypothetical protein
MAKARLLDDVLVHLPTKGCAPWHTTLPDDIAAELREIRAAFRAGKLPPHTTRTGLAHAISKSLKSRKINIGHAGVGRWLNEK